MDDIVFVYEILAKRRKDLKYPIVGLARSLRVSTDLVKKYETRFRSLSYRNLQVWANFCDLEDDISALWHRHQREKIHRILHDNGIRLPYHVASFLVDFGTEDEFIPAELAKSIIRETLSRTPLNSTTLTEIAEQVKYGRR